MVYSYQLRDRGGTSGLCHGQWGVLVSDVYIMCFAMVPAIVYRQAVILCKLVNVSVIAIILSSQLKAS